METDDIRNERDKKEYEIAFLVREEADGEAVRNLITRHGGAIGMAHSLRRIALAYKIGKETHAHFGFFRAELAPASAAALAKDLETAGATLRHLILISDHPHEERQKPRMEKTDESPKTPQPIVRNIPLSNEALEKKIEEILR